MSDLSKVCYRLETDDLDWFRKHYRAMGVSQALRLLMRRHRRAVEAILESRRQQEPSDELRISDSDLDGAGIGRELDDK